MSYLDGPEKQFISKDIDLAISVIKSETVSWHRRNYTNREMISWLLENVTRQSIRTELHEQLIGTRIIPQALMVYSAIIHKHYLELGYKESDERESRRLLDFIIQSVAVPLEEECFTRNSILKILIGNIHAWVIEELIRVIRIGLCVREESGVITHVFDARYSAAEFASENNRELDKLAASEEYRHAYRIALIKGFERLCEKLTSAQEDYIWVIDWYLIERGLVQDQILSKRALKAIKQACTKSDRAREIFQSIYDAKCEKFQKAFEWWPEYRFVDYGHYDIYYAFDDLMATYGITMQDIAKIQQIFPRGKRDDQPKGDSRNNSTIIKTNYLGLVLGALEKASKNIKRKVEQQQQSTEMRYFIVDIYPESVSGRKVARTHGDYFAIVYYYKESWWILVDSYRQGSAIYLWHGANKEEGLKLITKPKDYVKAQPGIYHRNHTLNTRSIFESYQLILSDAGGVDVLK